MEAIFDSHPIPQSILDFIRSRDSIKWYLRYSSEDDEVVELNHNLLCQVYRPMPGQVLQTTKYLMPIYLEQFTGLVGKMSPTKYQSEASRALGRIQVLFYLTEMLSRYLKENETIRTELHRLVFSTLTAIHDSLDTLWEDCPKNEILGKDGIATDQALLCLRKHMVKIEKEFSVAFPWSG